MWCSGNCNIGCGRMRPTSEEFEIAQDGLKRIEDAILQLLTGMARGGNCGNYQKLGLRSDFMGKQKDYLTYSILGGLLRKGQVVWNQDAKLFTSVK